MSSFICPFCNNAIALDYSTYAPHTLSFSTVKSAHSPSAPPFGTESVDDPYKTQVVYYRCPNCKKESIIVKGIGAEVRSLEKWFYPLSGAKKYPNYIPVQIRNDYEEAYAIVELSPKASATLSRRCLQGMIRDFWNVHNKKNLASEIDEIRNSVSPATRRALDATRQIGNIGAHMEQDVDKIIDIEPDEARALLKLIEYLMQEWYINRHESENLLNEIKTINDAKQELIHD